MKLVHISLLILAECFAFSADRVELPIKDNIKQVQDIGDVSGLYWYSDGKNVAGTVTIRKVGDVHFVRWTLADTMDYFGVGVRKGDTFSVSWGYSSAERSMFVRGLSLWKIEGKGMSGSWCSMPGDGKMSKESIQFISPLPKKVVDE